MGMVALRWNEREVLMSKNKPADLVKSIHLLVPMELRAFKKQLPELRKRFMGKFVAFNKGKMIAHGKKDFPLAVRVSRMKLGSPSLIMEVTPVGVVSQGNE